MEGMRKADQPEVRILVDGVFDSNDFRLVELSVDGHPYFLSPGQPVPGTVWRVDAVAIDHVVLTRSGAAPGSMKAALGATTKTYLLPALR